MVQESGEAHMTEAPKLIWAWPHFDGWITGDWSANTYHDERTVEYILATEHERIVAEKDAEIARLRHQIHEASEPDFLFGAMDNVYDFGVSIETFADAASSAIRAALENRDE